HVVRRDVETQGGRMAFVLAPARLEPFELVDALRRLLGREVLEGEAVGRQAGGGDGREQRRGAGNREDRNVLGEGELHEDEGRVRVPGRARVADERAGLAVAQAQQVARGDRLRVEVVVGLERLAEAVVVERRARVARVLRQDAVAGPQYAHGAEGDVLEVADGRGDEVEAGGE